MSNSQAEIKAIQERLRAIRSGQAPVQSAPSSTLMVELFPNHLPAPPSRSPQPPAVEQAGSTRLEAGIPEALLATLRSPSTALRDARREMSQPPSRPTPPKASLAQSPAQSVADFQQQLERKVQQINQLAAAQEAAMLEFKTLAERLERDRRALELQAQPYAPVKDSVPLCAYVGTAVPHVERDAKGSFILKNRAVDLFQSEREAPLAGTRPHRSGAERNSLDHASVNSPSREVYRSDFSSPARSKLARRRQSPASSVQWGKVLAAPLGAMRQWFDVAPSSETDSSAQRSQPVPMEEMGVQEGLLWFVGATMARVAIDLMLVSYPSLWLLAIALIAAPAAIAVYRVTVQPQTSIVWGYRLLAIMLGLLLGGRL